MARHFFVKLKLIIGEFEKSSVDLVTVESEEDVERAALLGEAHHDIDDGAYFGDGGLYDDFGGMHYKVVACQEVTDQEAAVLSKYLLGYTNTIEAKPERDDNGPSM